MKEAAHLISGVEWCGDMYVTMNGADALVVLTEWNAFRGLDTGRVMALMRDPVVIDLRNVYDPADMAAAGFRYVSIGRPEIDGRRPKIAAVKSGRA